MVKAIVYRGDGRAYLRGRDGSMTTWARIVARNTLGRDLIKGEEVHHVDGDWTNDSPSNLEVMTRREHAQRHPDKMKSVPSGPVSALRRELLAVTTTPPTRKGRRVKTLMCLCGQIVTAATLLDAWLLLDAHCDDTHGCPFQGRGGPNPISVGQPPYKPATKKAT